MKDRLRFTDDELDSAVSEESSEIPSCDGKPPEKPRRLFFREDDTVDESMFEETATELESGDDTPEIGSDGDVSEDTVSDMDGNRESKLYERESSLRFDDEEANDHDVDRYKEAEKTDSRHETEDAPGDIWDRVANGDALPDDAEYIPLPDGVDTYATDRPVNEPNPVHADFTADTPDDTIGDTDGDVPNDALDTNAEPEADADGDTHEAEVDGAGAIDAGDTGDTGDTADYSGGGNAETTADGTAHPDSKLRFDKREKRISKLEHKVEKYAGKRDKAKAKQPTREKKVKERVYNESKDKAETKIRFEQEAIPINEAKWNQPKKKPLPVKAVAAVTTMGVNKLHSKVYEVERENVGTQTAHRAELVGESVYRGGKALAHSGYRHVKNSPYRKAAKFEAKEIKTHMKLDYQRAVKDNPKLKSSPVSRFMQKRKIKQQYAEAYRKAKKSGQAVKKTGSVIAKTARSVTHAIRRNPVFVLKMGLLLLIVLAVMSLFTMCGALFTNTSISGAVSYAAEDADIDNAELVYTEWETDLQMEINNIESTHSGYDEYRYTIGDIAHNPYELMAFLTAVYQDFDYADVLPVLQGVFAEQYQLALTPEIEIRTRTETHYSSYTDDEGNEWSESYEVEVEYEWHILNVSLISNSFTSLLYTRMDLDQRQHFEMLMMTKGARQYVGNPFGMNWLPYVSSNYGYRVHPITGVKDYHMGIDIALPTGTEILAGLDGTVVQVGFDAGGYGNFVVIEDDEGLQAKYAHCHSVNVEAGQPVAKGDVIATVGNTGASTGAHLHMEIVKNGQYLNPLYFAETGDDGSGSIPPGMPGGVVIPPYSGEPMGDGSYAALLAEAESHLGKPYVFGANGPDSFDCSSYICWILTQSGVRYTPRTTAQGLFNMSTPVALSNAEPGDLLYFHSTYSTTDTVTHVALFLGGDLFIHAGNPIGYGNLSSSYWQEHFYAVGRIN